MFRKSRRPAPKNKACLCATVELWVVLKEEPTGPSAISDGTGVVCREGLDGVMALMVGGPDPKHPHSEGACGMAWVLCGISIEWWVAHPHPHLCRALPLAACGLALRQRQ